MSQKQQLQDAPTEHLYEQLFDIARDNLRHVNVVIAGPFTKELKNPDWCERLTERLGCPVEIHYVFL